MQYTIFGNCQSQSLSFTLAKNPAFTEKYSLKRIDFVQTLTQDDVASVQQIFDNSDLILYQHISKHYKVSDLATANLLASIKPQTKTISFVSMYFNAYFPHLDSFLGHQSILNLVHDYIIMYAFTKGLSEQQTLDLIQSDTLYSEPMSNQLFQEALGTLKVREEATNVKIAPFIEKMYRDVKLFNQFNHPKGIVFDYLANQIFDILNLPHIEISVQSKGVDGIGSPIYRSTYRNLGLTFEENFDTYKTREGTLSQEEVVNAFFKFYATIDRDLMITQIQTRKPFIVELFGQQGI